MLKTILDVNRWRGYIWYFLYYSYVQFFTSKGTMEIDRAGIKTCETLQHVRLIYLKRTLFDLAGTKNSSWTDRICFWQNMKIFAEIEFRQKRIIPFSCSSYFVSESYLTHNTYIFFDCRIGWGTSTPRQNFSSVSRSRQIKKCAF